MTALQQDKPDQVSALQLFEFWSAQVDALEYHLSDRWAAAAVAVVLVTYPIARIVIPVILHGLVPDVVRTVLKLI